MIKGLMKLILMLLLVMGISVAAQAGTITVGSATGEPGTQVSIPISIDMSDGVKTSCSFAVSFDTTKLEYTGKSSGDMEASLMLASVADINAAGKVQPIVNFEEGGPTSGTICYFKFSIKTGAAAGVTPLTIGEIISAPQTPALTGVSGSVTIKPAPCTGPTISVGTDTACYAGDTVDIPITIDMSDGVKTSCSFSISFDKTKLEYTGKSSGDMGASLMLASVADINAAGKVQPIVSFEEGGPTSGTIVIFKFKLLEDLTGDLPLTIGDLTSSPTTPALCGEDGAVEMDCPVPPTCEVSIEPETATVFEKSQLTFTATTTGENCAPPAYTWEVISTIGSTITQEGVYTAGSIASGTSAIDTVKVTDTANGNITASAVVTVLRIPQKECTVTISPKIATVDCGNTIQFSAVTSGTGCVTPAYQWSVTTTINSTIDQNGLYKAGINKTGSSRTDIVKVTDTANGNISDTALITVRDCSVVCKELVVKPQESAQGQIVKVKLTSPDKIFKNVKKEDIIVDFGSGITVNKITDKSEGSIKVEITIDANATIGTRTVLVTTPVDCAEGSFNVNRKPTITVVPMSGRAGSEKMDITIYGSNTHFAKDKTKVKFGDKIEVSDKKIVSSEKITAKIKIKKKAETGSRTVSVITNIGNDNKEVATGTFIVLPPAE